MLHELQALTVPSAVQSTRELQSRLQLQTQQLKLQSPDSSRNRDGGGETVASEKIKTSEPSENREPEGQTEGVQPLAVKIPHTMFFTYKHNVLETNKPEHFAWNVRRTIAQYKKAWGLQGADITKVRFLDDSACRASISTVEPKLVGYFDKEAEGRYKADICRVAALYQEGGYYFDVDIKVVEPLVLDNAQFVTVFTPDINPGGNGAFFQAFLASVPRHPVLKAALRTMLEYYTGERKLRPGTLMGTGTLKDAYDSVSETARQHVRLLEEVALTPEMYPDLRRQIGQGFCNHVCHDPLEKKVYFFSRIVGSDNCLRSQ